MNISKTKNKSVFTALLSSALLLSPAAIFAVEQNLSGIIDLRASATNSSDSYLTGGYGKFRYSAGNQLSLAQLAINYRADWENNISFHLVANGYADGENNGLGITEGLFKYRSLPNENGYRYQFRTGFMYPRISMENTATGWSSPFTLSFSTMNSWIAEEVRHLGFEASITKLGKIIGSSHDFTLSVAAFNGNDPNGSMLAWHGWTQSSRQSFWNEKLDFPNLPALDPGQPLEKQSPQSDPFKEVDSRIGYHLSGQWNWRGKSKVLIGYYDNRGGTDFVKEGQYSWITRFAHLGVKWNLAKDIILISQYMSGDTRMRVINNFDAVGIDFSNLFVLLTKKWRTHRFSTRIEKFRIKEFEMLVGDNNDENGIALTLSYAYQMDKNNFLQLEYNWINSTRPSRVYHNLEVSAVERQWQLAFRRYF